MYFCFMILSGITNNPIIITKDCTLSKIIIDNYNLLEWAYSIELIINSKKTYQGFGNIDITIPIILRDKDYLIVRLKNKNGNINLPLTIIGLKLPN